MRLVLLKVLVTVLVLIPLASGTLRAQRITTDPAWDYHPKWSPDGRTILFTSRRGGRTGIWAVPVEGGTPVELPTGLEGDHHISWSPDMTEIVFDAEEPDGRPNIWILTVETGEVRRVLPPGQRGPNVHPTWSPDGSRIAFGSLRAGSVAIWVYSLEDGALWKVSERSAMDGHPWWAPDGTTIAFDSDLSGSYDIWMVDADGGNLRQVTDDPRDEIQPCISPDRRLIAFTRRADTGDSVWIRSLADGREARLPTSTPCGWPTWSPDGARMACSARIEGSLDILVVDVSEIVGTLSRRVPS